METILYVNMSYDQLQELTKMEDENAAFEYLKIEYQDFLIESDDIISVKILPEYNQAPPGEKITRIVPAILTIKHK